MKWIIIGAISTIFTILIIILVVNMSRGEYLNHQEIDFNKYSELDDFSATCYSNHRLVISTEELYDGFLEHCGITAAIGYDQEFFNEKVIIVYLYDGSENKEPFAFYDYLFRHANNEIITVRYRNKLGTGDEVLKAYLIEIDRDDIGSNNILFD
jgi:hypothetical protein